MFISLFCLIIFLGVGYFYLNREIKPVEKNQEKIPYYKSAPENRGLVFTVSNKTIFLYFDFESEELKIFIENPIERALLYGYSLDYLIKTDYAFLEDIIDSLNGIELNIAGENLNCSGNQVCEILTDSDITYEKRKEIIIKVLKKMGEKGVTEAEINYLISATNTTLSAVDAYYWLGYLEILLKKAVIID